MKILSNLPFTSGLGSGSGEDSIVSAPSQMIHGIEAIIEYNGLYMNVRDWVDTYIVDTIMGLDDADVRDAREVNPGQHGETVGDAYYGGRTIVLQGKIQAKTLWKLRDMQTAMRMAFGDISQERALIFRMSDSNHDTQIFCKKKSAIQMAETQTTENHYERAFSITLGASNPRFVSVDEVYTVTTMTALEDWINEITNPSFEVNATGYTMVRDTGGTIPTISRVTTNAPARETQGTADQAANGRVTCVQAGNNWALGPSKATALNQRWYMRARVSGNASAGAPVRLGWRDDGTGAIRTDLIVGVNGSPISKTANGDGVVLEGILTIPASVAAVEMAVGKVGAAAADTFDIDGLMFVKLNTADTPAPTAYGDGTVTGWGWSGTAHASTSTRGYFFGDDLAFTLNNFGTSPALPQIEITGPVNHYVEILNEANGNFVSIAEIYDSPIGAVLAGQTLVYDFRKQIPVFYRANDGVNAFWYLAATSTDFVLERGENPIRVTYDEVAPGFSVAIRFNHTYLF